MVKVRGTLVAILVLVASAQMNAQNASVPVKEEKPGMLKEATIKPDAAEKMALAQVRGGRLSSAELEREGGRLIYSFDIKVAGKSGIEEINIDAKTGKLIAHEHEGPAKEKAEARSEHKDATAKPKPKKQ